MEPLPVRRRLTVLRDGSTEHADLVFCNPRGHSVPLRRCASCGAGGEVERDAHGRALAVGCSRFTLPAAGTGVTEVASELSVGLSLVRPAVCIAYDAPLRLAFRVLAPESGARGVAVVDADGRFMGMIPRARLSLALMHSGDDAAEMHMATDWSSVLEGASLGSVFGTMAASHARELSVLGPGRTFAGVVRDLEAMRFVAHVARTGSRPLACQNCA